MKTLCILKLLLLLLCLPITTLAQNLVPNPSFELYNSCPTGYSQINYDPTYTIFNTVQSWSNPVKFTSPDYFNACAAFSSNVSIPDNGSGYQKARTGNAYAGIIDYSDAFFNYNQASCEYIICKLTSPLIANKKYKAGFWINNAGQHKGFPVNQAATDAIGMKFSDTFMYVSGFPSYFSNIPYSIANPKSNFLTDTFGWEKISGSYIAHGGEQFLLIGWIHDVANPPQLQGLYPDPPIAAIYMAYYYIDDVFVQDFFCDTTIYTHDSLMCSMKPFTLSSKVGAKAYLWNTGTTTQSIQVNSSGNYWCMAAYDSCDLRIDTFHVKQYTDIYTSTKDVYGCNYSGKFDLQLLPVQTGSEYKWSTGDTSQFITVKNTGVYYRNTSNLCKGYVDTFHVQEFTNKYTSSADTIVCRIDNPFSATLSAIQGASHYLWNNGDTTQNLQIIDTGYYQYKAIKNCDLYTGNIHVIHKFSELQLDLGADTIICNDNDKFTLGRSLSNVKTYSWNTSDTVCCIKPITTKTYKLTISDGCNKLSDTIHIEVNDCEDCVFMPTAFTPNNDGRNDKITAIVTCPIDKFEYRIYDRWGNQVFITNIKTEGWNGSYNGTILDIGTYFYFIKYTVLGDTRQRIVKGDFILLK